MTSGFVYKWTNNINGKWYIGSHKGTPTDGYKATGKAIKRAFKKHGIENFTRTILYEGTDYRIEEERILKALNAAQDQKSYNMKNNAVGGNGEANKGRVFSVEHKQKLSISHQGKASTRRGLGFDEIYGEKAATLRKQISMKLKGIRHKSVICPFCLREGANPIMHRYHFDKCKDKKHDQQRV